MNNLHGVTTATITPFETNGTLNTEKLQQLTEFLIEKGVNCLYPMGTTGEMLKMSEQERMTAAKTVVDTAKDRCTAYIHTGASDLDQVIRLSRHAYEIGAKGIGVVTPVFFGLTPRETIHYYTAISKSLPADFPIYLYNIPQCAANDLTAQTASEIAEKCPNVVGIKYSWSDMLRTYEYLGIRNNSFSVVQGTDRLFLPALAAGCAGTVSGISSVYPEPFVKVYEAWKNGDIATARLWQNKANKIANILKCGANLAVFKSALEYRGLFASSVRRPQLDLTAPEQDALWKNLADFEKELL